MSEYSQTSIININKILHVMRLIISRRKKIVNFSVEELVMFAELALAQYNDIPNKTNYTFEDTLDIDQIANDLVYGAYYMALVYHNLNRPKNITVAMHVKPSRKLVKWYSRMKLKKTR